jgi:hypothetical protein
MPPNISLELSKDGYKHPKLSVDFETCHTMASYSYSNMLANV